MSQLAEFDIFEKIDNNEKRTKFYTYQKTRNSKVSYGNFLKDYEKYLRLKNTLLHHQTRMMEKYGCFHLYLKE